MASSIFSVPFGGSGAVGNVVGINTLTNAQHYVDVADSAMYTVVADEAARLALTTPYDRYVYQTDTAEVWYWDTVGSAWEKDTPVIKHFVDSGNAYHQLLLPEYSLLKTLGDTIHEYEIWEGITSGTGGTVTVPAHGTIVLDQYVGGSDCLITKVDATTGRPVDEPARDSGGVIITGTLDIAGNYTLSATPDAYPVAIIFQIQLAERYKTAELTPAQILNETELPTAARVTFDDTVSLLGATNVQDAIDLIRTQADTSHGVVTLPTITDNLDGSVAIGAGVANFGTAADGDNVIVRLATPAADPVALTDGQVNYVYADYNAGTPSIAVTLVPSGFISDARLVPLFRVIREGTDLHILDYDEYAIGLADKLFYKEVTQRAFERQSGLVLSTAATRISTVSAGSAWFGVQLYTLDTNVAGSAGELEYYYPVSGVWNKTTVTEYDSTYYSDGTDQQTLGVAKYVAKYFFRGVETDNHVYYISGNQFNTAAEALAEAVPTAPSVITSHSLYVGKIVIQQGATNGIAYPRAWEGTVSTAGAVNHNDLANRDAAGSHASFIPLADSTTAFQFFKADGTTAILGVDTTNGALNLTTNTSTAALVERKMFNGLMENTPDSTLNAAVIKFQVPDDGVEPITVFTSEQTDNDVSAFGFFSSQAGNFRLGTAKKSENVALITPLIFGSPSLIEHYVNTRFSGNIAIGTNVSNDINILSLATTGKSIAQRWFAADFGLLTNTIQIEWDIWGGDASLNHYDSGVGSKVVAGYSPSSTMFIYSDGDILHHTTNGTVFSKDVRASANLVVGDNPGTTSKRQLLLYENSATAELIQFCNSATGFASSSDGLVVGITSAGQGYFWNYDNQSTYFGVNNAEVLRLSENISLFGNAILESSITITAGTYNALDVTGVNIVYCNTNAGDIIINGTTGASGGQTVKFVKVDSANSITLNHENASGTQKIRTYSLASVSYSQYRGTTYNFNGQYWYCVTI